MLLCLLSFGLKELEGMIIISFVCHDLEEQKEQMMSDHPELILKQIETGPMQNFIYFIGDATLKEVAVVDPAWDVAAIRHEAQNHGWQITKILLTHGHPDHVNGIKELQKTHDVPVFLSKHEANYYVPPCRHLHRVEDAAEILIGGLTITCLHTPGHTPGGQCFRYQDILITGDTLFIDGCGRCDLPGGDAQAMYHSLFDVISKLPDHTVIYPGHNYGSSVSATLASQKQTNPYLTTASKQDFLRQRMGIYF
jgi:glyoxylase-like metal-dependent hydrolase (beta-lactamase superfamily II)